MWSGDIFIIPVLLDHCEVPDELRHLHVVRLYQSDGHAQLTDSIRSALNRSFRSLPPARAPEVVSDWRQSYLSPEEEKLYQDPTDDLTRTFLNDLLAAAKRQRIVLMFDVFEHMSVLSVWVREFARRLNARILLVIAGREGKPQWDSSWPDWIAVAEIATVKPLARRAMVQLVCRYYREVFRATLPQSRAQEIARFARGLPLAALSATKLIGEYRSERLIVLRPDILRDVIAQLTEGLPPRVLTSLKVAAALRLFTQELLCGIASNLRVEVQYDELVRFPFVECHAGGHAVHDAIREIIDENIRLQEGSFYRKLHQLTADYYSRQASEAIGATGDRLRLEELYHRVVTYTEMRPGRSRQGLWKEFMKVYRESQAISDMIQVETPALELRLLRIWLWTWALAGRLHRCETDARRALELAAELNDSTARLRILRDLGWALGMQSRFMEAEECFQDSIQIAATLGDEHFSERAYSLGFRGALLHNSLTAIPVQTLSNCSSFQP